MKSRDKNPKAMYSRLSRLVILFVVMIFSISCEHETEPPDGPNLIDRFGPFTVLEELEANRTTVDFSSGETVIFTAEFNKNVDWVITITGSVSGSVKVIEGFDREVNAVWDGGATELPLFRNEECTVELIVPEEPDFLNTVDVEIIGTKVYEGSLFWDFEEEASISDIFIGNFEFELTGNTGNQSANPLAAEGEFFYLMEGTDDVVPNFFVGLIQMNPSLNDVTYVELPSLIPEDVYFNFFLYNDGRPYGIAVIQFAYDTNDNGQFDDGVDALFQLEGDFPLDFEGWRQYSHTMADAGMTSSDLEKIVAIRVLLISNLNSQPTPPEQVQFGIDFMTFTQGSPLSL